VIPTTSFSVALSLRLSNIKHACRHVFSPGFDLGVKIYASDLSGSDLIAKINGL
jgi:hypothetical protein